MWTTIHFAHLLRCRESICAIPRNVPVAGCILGGEKRKSILVLFFVFFKWVDLGLSKYSL